MQQTNPSEVDSGNPQADSDQTQTIFRPVHQDRRSLPRVTLRCPGQVMLDDQKLLKVIIHDVSRDGLQIRCDKTTAAAINPTGRAIKDGPDAPELQAVFEVPLSTGPGRVRVRGTLMYFALIAPDVAAFGMRFKSISRSGVENLRAVVRAALEPGSWSRPRLPSSNACVSSSPGSSTKACGCEIVQRAGCKWRSGPCRASSRHPSSCPWRSSRVR